MGFSYGIPNEEIGQGPGLTPSSPSISAEAAGLVYSQDTAREYVTVTGNEDPNAGLTKVTGKGASTPFEQEASLQNLPTNGKSRNNNKQSN